MLIKIHSPKNTTLDAHHINEVPILRVYNPGINVNVPVPVLAVELLNLVLRIQM